jgi:hypothetical protein
MKKINLIVLLLFVTSFFASCTKTGSTVEITHVPVKLKEDGNWSLLELKTGKLLFEGEFKNKPSVVVEGFFISENDKGKKFYNKIADEKNYKQIAGPFYSAQPFTEGIAIVCKEDDYVSAINTKGEELFKLKPENGVDFEYVGQCHEGMIVFRAKNGYLGYLDKEGKVAIKPQYDYAEDFKGGLARVSKNVKNKDNIQVIDKDGKEITKLDYALSGNIDGGLMAYSNTKNEFGVINVEKDKEKLITASSKYEQIIIRNGDIFYSVDEEWGMLDAKGEIKIRSKYDRLSRINADRFLGIKKDGDDLKYEILDNNGEVLKSQDTDEAFVIGNGHIIVLDGKDYELKNQDGEAVGKETFKVIDGLDEYLRLSYGESNGTRSQYFDWSVIEKSLDKINQNSIMGIALDANCITAEKQMNAISLNDNGSAKEEKESEGMAKRGSNIWMGIFNNYFIGSGYADEGEETIADEADAPVGEPQSEVPSPVINDQAPDWSNYQRSLTKNISISRNSEINLEVWFDNTIKSAITNTVYKTDAYWGYTYPVTETVGYEKNANAKIYYVSVKYDVESTKEEKLKKLFADFIKKSGFKFSSESVGKKSYTDSKNNVWTVDGTSIVFEKEYGFSTVIDSTAVEAAH